MNIDPSSCVNIKNIEISPYEKPYERFKAYKWSLVGIEIAIILIYIFILIRMKCKEIRHQFIET